VQYLAATGMNADHGIDPANKELYLSDEDFLTAFAMDKDAFKATLHETVVSPWMLVIPGALWHMPWSALDILVSTAGEAQVASGAAEEKSWSVLMSGKPEQPKCAKLPRFAGVATVAVQHCTAERKSCRIALQTGTVIRGSCGLGWVG
jgi:Villin headpiece domain